MKKIIFIYLIFITLTSCTEPYALITNNNDNYLVVEANITNELKKQTVKLSRSFNFQETTSAKESGAIVYIKDDNGTQYDFVENNNQYESVNAFLPQNNVVYQLFITTNDGQQYQSQTEVLPAVAEIETLTPTVKNYFGVRGVAINATIQNQGNNAKYFKYEYEETYKIIPPKWSQDSLRYTGFSEFDYYIFTSNRTSESQTCFRTDLSTDIILNTTSNQTSGNINNLQVHFLSQENTNISHRYSILVKQYVINETAYRYFETLKKFSSNGGFSPSQPGFIISNIKAINSNKKVIGFFNLATVSYKRTFFNYSDLFPQEPLPPYYKECNEIEYDRNLKKTRDKIPTYGLTNLVTILRLRSLVMYENKYPLFDMVVPECGDCRVLGTNQVPNFWIE